MVRRLNIDGDGQGDLTGHGGEQRAVLVYQIESYRHWQQHFGRDDFSYGEFGENLTVDGLPDDEVCIGDRYRIGEAEFEVTQPRVTCYRVGLRLGEPELPALLVGHHRPGFYMRVITEGHIQAGDQIVKTRTGPDALTVADTDALLYLPGPRPGQAARRRWRSRPSAPAGRARSATCWPRPRATAAAAPPGAELGRARPGPASGRCGWTRWSRRARRCPRSTSPPPTAPRCPPPRAGQYLTLRVTGAGQPAPVRSYSLSSAPGRQRLPDQRQARAARRRQQLPEPQPATRGDPGRGRAPRRLRPRRRHRPGAAHLRRHRRHAGAGHAARARGPPQRARHLVAPRGARAAASTRSPPRRTPCSPPSRTPASTCSTAQATPAERRRGHAAAGRLTEDKLAGLGLPASASAYICGPASFMTDMQRRADRDRHRPGPHPHRAVRRAAVDQPRPDRADPPAAAPAARAARHRAAGHLRPQRPHHAVRRQRGAACSNSPTPATSPPAGAAAPASATPASRRCSPATSPTPPTRWNPQPTARCSSAAPAPPPTSSWTCRNRQPTRTYSWAADPPVARRIRSVSRSIAVSVPPRAAVLVLVAAARTRP